MYSNLQMIFVLYSAISFAKDRQRQAYTAKRQTERQAYTEERQTDRQAYKGTGDKEKEMRDSYADLHN